ncbi:ABC transporter substrate-binding protein [Peribacillus psychrosaccharolyticus]|uniref:ABC transporter substrate-binding protein n=1 Tax=Peribacillus psychrosaccharolyticus TaxID=1407 RepID=A0A974RYZ2_PERPY|nr:ABC transporter substrate-binding protein [Peribacillus psychrosaccharolyticus]MEC2055295.1 ABC transporter substrate-binding protein [Peribacillus psychrosaccharolyticus]MED3745285.1 ABC transporter substrate-binding protein [Peribacillus psychrosaccharolyticus]QQS98991.1 ABC transporter substrate-binding protein [Peribacillus psychrosaccharolyticus]
MKKFGMKLFTGLLVIGILTGCGSEVEEKQQQSASEIDKGKSAVFPVTLKDATGEQVTIEEEPQKIVSLIPSNTEIAFAMDLGEKIVGVSDYDNYPKETADIEKIGDLEFNVEKIISLSPDLVLAHESTADSAKEGLQQLRDSGISVVVINDAANFKDVYSSIEMLGKATGANHNANVLIDEMKTKLRTIEEKAAEIKQHEQKKVLVEVSGSPEIYVTGKNTFLDEMLQLINAKNAAADQEGWAKMEEESMIEENPDVIVTTYGRYVEDVTSDILNRNGWEAVTAIKEKQVVDVNEDLVTRSGPRLAEGVEELAKAVYPDVFK